MASLCAPIFTGSWITIETARNVSVSQLRNNDHMIRIIGEREGEEGRYSYIFGWQQATSNHVFCVVIFQSFEI